MATSQPALARPRKSLLIRTGGIGDFILTLPLLDALSARGELSLVCRRPHLALLPHGWRPAAWLDAESAAAASFYGGAPDDLAKSLADNAEVHVFATFAPEINERLRRMGALNVVWHNPRPSAPRSAARSFLLEAGVEPGPELERTPFLQRNSGPGDCLWIHAGSGSPAKNLPPEFWAGLLDKQGIRESGHPVLISFGECETRLLPRFRQLLGSSFQPIERFEIGKLRQEMESRACMYWGADTGISHLAAALGIPCHVHFVSTDPRIWAPCGNVKIVRHDGPTG